MKKLMECVECGSEYNLVYDEGYSHLVPAFCAFCGVKHYDADGEDVEELDFEDE